MTGGPRIAGDRAVRRRTAGAPLAARGRRPPWALGQMAGYG
ncbi:hypothetical protein CU044_4158 [Streptomyces sp. L-9-10]|nr:hypothetical protein CU044_4158 [Streptomyces sp. L-9-10]